MLCNGDRRHDPHSLTPEPGGDHAEVRGGAGAAADHGLAPSCRWYGLPGLRPTTSTFFQELAERIQSYLREQMPIWEKNYRGVET